MRCRSWNNICADLPIKITGKAELTREFHIREELNWVVHGNDNNFFGINYSVVADTLSRRSRFRSAEGFGHFRTAQLMDVNDTQRQATYILSTCNNMGQRIDLIHFTISILQ